MRTLHRLLQTADRRSFFCGPAAMAYVLFAASVAWPVLKNVYASCYGYYDLGIYSQAVARLRLDNLNPWLTGRQIKIFNDHFDPIIALVVPLARTLGAAPALVIFESLSIVAATVPIVYLWRTGRLCRRNAVFALVIVLFHPCVIYALQWPAHPTTWAIAPAIWLSTAMVLEAYPVAIASYATLLCCKEEFVYVGFVLMLWLMRRRCGWGAWAVGVSTAAWTGWVFAGRNYFLGATMGYAHKFTQDIWPDPIAAGVARLGAPNLPFDAAAALCAFGLLSGWCYRQKIRPAWGALALAAPLLGIRFLAQMWSFHYNAVTLGFCVAAFLPPLMVRPLPRWVIACSLLGLAAMDGHIFSEEWPIRPALRARALAYCPQDPGRLQSLRRAYALALSDPAPLMAEENLMQHVVTHPDVYMFNGPQGPGKTYGAVLFEKPPHGIAWEFTPPMIAALIEQWRRQPDTRALVDDAFVFYARGAFVAPAYEAAAGP